MTAFASTLATIWRLAAPYFRGEDRWPGRTLLAAVVAIELSIIAINVLLNQWNARFFNAIQDRDWDGFVAELIYFCTLAAAYIVLAVYQLYLNQWLQIRWRRWMTAHYLDRWLEDSNHYRMQVLGDAADNPDQRIAEDIRLFIERTLRIGIGLLSAIVSLASFVAILWTLSAAAPLVLFGTAWTIPGYLVWAALIYAVVGTLVTHLIGRSLIRLNFEQQRYEADFRFNLVRVRENAEQIALLDGEPAEHTRLMDRFGRVVLNWLAIMRLQKRLTFFTAGYRQVSNVFPYIVVSPGYFAGHLQLGALTQTASAFSTVQSAFSFFIDVYVEFAEWRAVIARLEGFDAAARNAAAAATTPPVIAISRTGGDAVEIRDLSVDLPTGRPIVAARDLTLAAGEHALLTGPTGSGKSSLFRAIGGIWPFGTGTITVPRGARLMILPQRPYLPVGTLEAAVGYPAPPGACDRTRIADTLAAVGLPALAARLDEDAHWHRILSPGEQQRLAIARALLHAPDWLLLDEATASIDEPGEAQLYHLIRERLPNTTIVSIGHRSSLRPFHRRHLIVDRGPTGCRVRDMPVAAAAQ